MIQHGNPPYLECSSKGDKRLSAFSARIRSRNNQSIEEIYQAAKIFSDGATGLNWRMAKGRNAINQDEVRKLYSQLWDEYIKENPELIAVIKNASGLSDMFGQAGRACQATELWRIREEYREKENQISSTGSIRIGNKRVGALNKPEPGEIAIDVDRNNPILGNKYILRNHLDDRERNQVISLFRADYIEDWNKNGPMRKETERIANMAATGKKIILMCWCSGSPMNKPCHADIIKEKIDEILIKENNKKINYEVDKPTYINNAQQNPNEEYIKKKALNFIFPDEITDNQNIFYTGIGWRDTPTEICDAMTLIAAALEKKGYILRSGGANGSDHAFQSGLTDPQNGRIFIPWIGFQNKDGLVKNGLLIKKERLDQATEIASKFHPHWDKLSQGPKTLHTRNVPQVLGENLDTPSRAIICYTKDGKFSGGTGQALRIAHHYKIPIINLHNKLNLKLLTQHLGINLPNLKENNRSEHSSKSVSNEGKAESPSQIKNLNPFDQIEENPIIEMRLKPRTQIRRHEMEM